MCHLVNRLAGAAGATRVALAKREHDEHQLPVRGLRRREHQAVPLRLAHIELLATGQLGAVGPLGLALHELRACYAILVKLPSRRAGDSSTLPACADQILAPGTIVEDDAHPRAATTLWHALAFVVRRQVGELALGFLNAQRREIELIEHLLGVGLSIG